MRCIEKLRRTKQSSFAPKNETSVLDSWWVGFLRIEAGGKIEVEVMRIRKKIEQEQQCGESQD